MATHRPIIDNIIAHFTLKTFLLGRECKNKTKKPVTN